VVAGVGYALQALADFLASEDCHACGRPVATMRSLAAPAHSAAAALAQPLHLGPRFAGVDTHPLCRACCHRLSAMHGPVRVGTIHRDGAVSLNSGGGMEPTSPLPLAHDRELRVWAAFETDDRLLAVVHALKFARRERLGPWLARALSAGLPAAALPSDGAASVVAVPTDPASLRRRGFNQAECVARAFATNCGAAFVPRGLAKTRATAPQSTLDGAARARNVAGAFAVVERARVSGCCVVLVDDLVTTGATAAACAVALYAAGAREVRVACVGYRP